MLLSKLTRVLIGAALTLAFVGGGAIVGHAEKAEVQYKKKRCIDYDKEEYDIERDEESTTGDCSGTVPTPEPISIILFTAGLAGIGFAARRHFRRSEDLD